MTESSSPNVKKPSIPPAKKPRNMVLRLLGPGLVTGAADDDPSGIATYSQAGAQFGYGLLWTVFLTTPFMIAIQLVSARIGRVTGKGLAANVMELAPRWLVLTLVFLLVAANTFNIAADIAAMGESLSLVIGGLNHEHALIFAATSTLLQVFVPYRRYAPVLKFLTLSLFAYVATALTVNIPWRAALLAAVWPKPVVNADYFMMVVAVLGTTISPYLFFWQAAQEVEDTKAEPVQEPLRRRPRQGPAALARIRLDTAVGMGFSNLVALAILATTAATLHAAGIHEVTSAAQAADALRPIAGRFAFALFALGIVGTGLLSVPVLAGSAAYALGEARRWPVGLARQPKQAKAFYAAIGVATLIGAAVNIFSIGAVKALIWSAVLNAIVAVPVMAVVMRIATNRRIMGTFKIEGRWSVVGWLATAVMAVASVAFLVSLILPTA
jgi:NRAMP (natural resistance-associated macrophage protein)-like metal ion transporter